MRNITFHYINANSSRSSKLCRFREIRLPRNRLKLFMSKFPSGFQSFQFTLSTLTRKPSAVRLNLFVLAQPPQFASEQIKVH